MAFAASLLLAAWAPLACGWVAPASSAGLRSTPSRPAPAALSVKLAPSPPPAFLPDAALITAGFTTWSLHNFGSFTPVSANALVGLCSGALFPTPIALAAYCGSLTGVATTRVIPSKGIALVVLATSAVVLRGFNKYKILMGRGGRLGLAAQFACSAVFLGRILATPTIVGASFFQKSAYSMALLDTIPTAALGSLIGTTASITWQRLLKGQPRIGNPVTASGLTAGLGCLLMPAKLHGPILAGSLVAMSAPTVLSNIPRLASAAICCGVWQVGLAGVLNGGWSGKLGCAAILGVLTAEVGRKKAP